ncbi:hypothetical protein GR160_03670 [Flavobacterium sp. Sd200]|uniref:hypothetical protein n=1 Tax=Flavobacterium sp. Sd200 TaxID=2692211 RepID=UPI00145068A5|nr:hypothetical protein [Flavobacterium sp. Sd200]MXN90314.1 hypothetical protein [Flavobacterium sp. Sd200]
MMTIGCPKTKDTEIEWEPRNSISSTSAEKISSLPLEKEDWQEFIETANLVFENVLDRIEPARPVLVRELWDAEKYIYEVLRPEMLPIDRDYALSLIEAFLVHHVIGLAVETEK